jgi:branched-chain amino acid transport system permease protein
LRDALVAGDDWRAMVLRLADRGPIIPGVVLLAVVPLFVSSPVQSLLTKVLIFALFAMSLDILIGYTGLFPLGHAAFFGTGGYVAAILMVNYGYESFWITAPLGVAAAAVIAALFGVIALRVSDAYFLLVTFALGQLLFSIAWKWVSVTGGSDGVPGVGRPALGLAGFAWSSTSFYYFVLVIFGMCFFLLNRIVQSPFGRALVGIRECELRARCLGYNTWLYKYIAFVVAGTFGGVAGVLFAFHAGIMVPAHLGVLTSALVFVMVIIGGPGTLIGPVLGATVIVFVEYYANILAPERWLLILGGVFVVSVSYARGGIAGPLLGLWRRMVAGVASGGGKRV